METPLSFFAPQLIIRDCAVAIDFYKAAFGVQELRRWNNEDGTVHVAELLFQGRLFHIHEPSQPRHRAPEAPGGVTVIIGVFVDDPHGVFARAVAAGAEATSPVMDYDYGYRQGTLTDPFGHEWLIEKKI
jgi:PhnB protein